MADVKISALPAATTPLAGTELVPIVQSGVTSRVSIDNVTAGRTVAASTVNVDANTASAAVRITQTGAGNALLVEDSANPDATPFVVTSAGDVGIGTSSPSSPLTVKAESAGYIGIRVLEAAGVAGSIQFINDPVSAERGSFIATAAGNMRMYGTSTAEFYTGNSERMRITSGGFVGINNTNPSAILNVTGHNEFTLGFTAQTSSTQTAMLSQPVAILANTSNAAGNGLGLRFNIADTGGTSRTVAGVGAVATAKTASTVDGDMYFYTGLTERMRITSTGNAGIGVSPATRFEVSDASRFRLDVSAASVVTTALNSAASAFATNTTNALDHQWQTSGSERMRITSDGNVCIGTTAAGTSAEEVLAIGTGVAPTTGPADTIQIYSTDLSAGNTILSLFTEGTPVNANVVAAATHRIAVRINGTVYYLLANTSA